MIDKHETTAKSVWYDFPQENRTWTLLRPYCYGNDNFWWMVRTLICWYFTNRSNDSEWQCERCKSEVINVGELRFKYALNLASVS